MTNPRVQRDESERCGTCHGRKVNNLTLGDGRVAIEACRACGGPTEAERTCLCCGHVATVERWYFWGTCDECGSIKGEEKATPLPTAGAWARGEEPAFDSPAPPEPSDTTEPERDWSRVCRYTGPGYPGICGRPPEDHDDSSPHPFTPPRHAPTGVKPTEERWPECGDCGWNLGVEHLFTHGPTVGVDLSPGNPCPACGEPLVEVCPASLLDSTRKELEAAKLQNAADVARFGAMAEKAEQELAEVKEERDEWEDRYNAAERPEDLMRQVDELREERDRYRDALQRIAEGYYGIDEPGDEQTVARKALLDTGEPND